MQDVTVKDGTEKKTFPPVLKLELGQSAIFVITEVRQNVKTKRRGVTCTAMSILVRQPDATAKEMSIFWPRDYALPRQKSPLYYEETGDHFRPKVVVMDTQEEESELWATGRLPNAPMGQTPAIALPAHLQKKA